MILEHICTTPNGAIFTGPKFRSLLWRTPQPLLVSPGDPWCCFIGLNPSYAGADPASNDNTVRLWNGHAARNGFKRWVAVNVYDYIATDPKDLITAGSPSSARNVDYVVAAVRFAGAVVCCWGDGADHEVTRALESRIWDEGRVPMALGITLTGKQPRHPRGVPTTARFAPLFELRGWTVFDYEKWLVQDRPAVAVPVPVARATP